MTARRYGLPLDTPLDREPDARMVEAAEMWRIALAHVGVLAGWDTAVAAWVRAKDSGTIATVASWLRRAWQAGLAAGRAEGLAEAETDLHVLAADIDRLADHADLALTEGEAGAQEVLEELLAALRSRVSGDVPPAEVLAEVGDKARRRYFSILAGDVSTAQRQTAVTIATDTAVTGLVCDSNLAAATRAIIGADRELDDAIADLGDDDAPGEPVRSVVLPAAVVSRLLDTLESVESRPRWTHRADGLLDVRLTPADVTQLRAADAQTDASIGVDGMLVVDGRRYEVGIGWPSRGTGCRYCPADGLAARVAERIAADAQVDDVRGFDGTAAAGDDAEAVPDGGTS